MFMLGDTDAEKLARPARPSANRQMYHRGRAKIGPAMTCKRSAVLPRPRPGGRVLAALAVVALVALAAAGGLDLPRGDLLTLLPLFLLVAVLALRPYAGERLIARLRRSRVRRARPGLATASQRPRPSALARGGSLIATAMAGRAPPPPLAG
jgi:hypothetical protein